MTDKWSERIASHPAISLLDTVSAVLEEAPVANPNASAEALQYMQRAQTVISNFRARLNSTEAWLIPLAVLDNAVPHLQTAQAEIQAFLSDNDETHLRNSDDHLDRLLMEMRSLPALAFPGEAEVATKAAQDYAQHLSHLEDQVRTAFVGLRQEMDAQSTSFTESANDTERRLEDATKAAEQQFAALGKTADERAAEIVAESETKIAELRAEIGTQKGRLDQAIAQQQSSFAEEQSRRLEQFSGAQEKRETAFAERTEALIAEMRPKLEALAATAASSVEELSRQERRAAQIVGITAASNVAESYIKEAKEQRQQADWWRYGALAFVAILIGYAVFLALVAQPAADSSVAEWLRYLGTKASLGGLIGAPFFYATGQSGRHRRREEEAKRLALELTSFRPFLSELPEQERAKEIIAATPRYFPGAESSPSPNEG
jgi:hypothetical protein